ncbi:MAG: hypothetical protein JRF29_08765 [Deltaproteobacteria bacterium]|nr:hypothetical protein [Deltaproteobacteria bacterium]
MDPKATTKSYVYQAPILYVAFFYVLLATWAIVCVIFLGLSFNKWGLANFFQLFMFAFVLFYTCYFSAAISYKIEVWDKGDIRLTSFRRIINIHAEEIPLIEGPHLPVGFIRFRLEREKAYLFGLTHNAFLKTVLVAIKSANPDIMFKRL